MSACLQGGFLKAESTGVSLQADASLEGLECEGALSWELCHIWAKQSYLQNSSQMQQVIPAG